MEMLLIFVSYNFIEFIRSNSILIESLELSIYKILSSTNRENFTSFFPILMHFISYLIALARAPSTVLNRNSGSEHHCPIPDHREKTYPLTIDCDFSCRPLIYDLYYVGICSSMPKL